MVEIPLPPRSHHKANKLTDKEQEKRNKKLSSSILTRGWVKNKEDKRCNPKEVSLDLQRKYEEPVYPVCPALRKWIKQEKRYSLPDIKKTNLPQLDSIIKILVVFNSLTQSRPNQETVVRWAHSENVLTERLDLIRNDLLALPQSLEKDFPETAKECKELVAELKLAEWRYSMHGQSFVYLLPYNLEYGNWATFLEWRELQGNRAKLRSFSTEIEMCRLTRHYPAEAIKAMLSLRGELSPLALKLLPDKIQESNQLKTDFEKMFEEFSEQLTKPARSKGGQHAIITPVNYGIKKSGSQYVLSFEGSDEILPKKFGSDYIVYLLTHKDRDYSALQLESTCKLKPNYLPMKTKDLPEGIREVEHESDLGNMADYDPAELQSTIRHLEEQIKKTDKQAEKEGHQDKIDFINKCLASTVNINGRKRKTGDPLENARIRVTQAIKDVQNNIKGKKLKKHLQQHIHTGSYLSYKPDDKIFWDYS